MHIEPAVRLADKIAVELLIADATLIAGDKQDALALRVEGDSDAPLAAPLSFSPDAQILHVGVLGIVQRINTPADPAVGQTAQPQRQSRDFRICTSGCKSCGNSGMNSSPI